MAVIDTSMDMPDNCYVCEKRNCCQLARGNGWLCDKRDDFCPLKSTDEMIAEIDKIAYVRTLATDPFAQGYSKIVGYDSLMKVMHKYCDKEDTNGNA